MRFLHTSDWHLGAMSSGLSLRDDQEHFIKEIREIAAAEKTDAVLIAGDVYDRSVASSEAIKLYDEAMTGLCLDLHIPVIVIAGNHDGADRLESCSELLASADLHVCGSLKKDVRKVCVKDTDIYLLPWITEEKVKSIYPGEKDRISSVADAYRVAVEKITEDFDPDKRHVLLAHAFISDSETSTSDRAAVIGTAMQVPADIFDAFDYTALGHLHKPQYVNEKIRYSGTPMAYSFGSEEQQEKSVTIVDTETMEHRIIPLHPLHKRTTLSGTLEDLLHPDDDEDIVNGFVKINVSDRMLGLSGITQLREVYPRMLECSGLSYESETSAISLTVEEYEAMQTDPVRVFESFCREVCGMDPDEHLKELFEEAVMKSGEAED